MPVLTNLQNRNIVVSRGYSLANIHTIRRKVISNEYEFTIPHFFEEMANDHITFSDIERAIANGRISRKFTRDTRGIRYEVV